MTTRNIVIDNLVNTQLDIGTTLVGSKYTKSASGQNNPKTENPYNVTVGIRKEPIITYSIPQYNYQWRTATVSSLFGPWMWEYPPLNKLELGLLDRLVSQARGHDWNAAVDLAESRQALHMVRSNVVSIATAIRQLKRGDVGGALRILGHKNPSVKSQKLTTKGISNQWLEIQYGWLPLLSSSYEAMKWLETKEREPVKLKVRGSASHARSYISSSAFSSPFSGDVRTRIQYIWKMSRDQPGLSTLAELGFLDPEVILWEKVPYSFVVDWFVPIGTWLETRAFLKKASGQYIRSQSTIARIPSCPPVKSSWGKVAAGGYSQSYFSFGRTVGNIATIPVPAPAVRWGLEGKRIANAIALARNLIR
ncbi:TPA_asm: maturation protein [ssRNA phage EMS014]|uniref:Maturation protein n=1 Tax=ssRNA phage EMS014 TaxID=2785993 RepID=A0A8S5KX75_9VIRU|nr:maturation protein [ssRNA phage EMS014]DAD49870.1 TPA_asm: maturation protein [ssRNA phage EMS014]